ncbi:MAG: hypothetical protein ABIX01_22375 [Chitinophagaceae bacterium]
MHHKETIVPNWYTVDNIDTIDSPALLVYLPRVKENSWRREKDSASCGCVAAAC